MHPPAPRTAPPLLPRATLLAILVLTAVTTVLGLLDWPRPAWGLGSWTSVAGPVGLWALLLGAALACLTTAVVLVRRATDLRPAEPAALGIWALLVVTAAALLWNARYAAALSQVVVGAVTPIFHWLFTFLPPLLALPLVGRRDRRTRTAVALATGVVSLPLFALSWSLLAPGLTWSNLLGSLWTTAVLGVVPFAVGVRIAGARTDPPSPSADPYVTDGPR